MFKKEGNLSMTIHNASKNTNSKYPNLNSSSKTQTSINNEKCNKNFNNQNSGKSPSKKYIPSSSKSKSNINPMSVSEPGKYNSNLNRKPLINDMSNAEDGDDEEGWVTVKKKVSKKNKVEERDINNAKQGKQTQILSFQQPEVSLTKEDKDLEKLIERKKTIKLKRKQKVKEEKKRLLEQKAKAIEEMKKKDTKFSFISNELINQFDSLKVETRNSNRYQRSHNSFNDFPILSKTTQSANSSVSPWSKISRVNSDHDDQAAPIMQPSNKPLVSEPTTRKVKAKDAITFNLSDIIVNRKSKSSNNERKLNLCNNGKKGKKSAELKTIVEKRGIQSQTRKKRISVLKKRINRLKLKEQEIVMKILNDNMKQRKKVDTSNTDEEMTTNKFPETMNFNIVKDTDEALKNLNQMKCELSQKEDTKELTEEKESPQESKEDILALNAVTKRFHRHISPLHKSSFREYCDHLITKDILNQSSELILLVVKFQDRLFHTDPLKLNAKRRYFCGLKEASKHMNKLACLIMAPDLARKIGEGLVDENINKVLDEAKLAQVPVVFGPSRYKLGKLTRRHRNVACVAIVNYQGCEDIFNQLMNLVSEARKEYQNSISKEDDVITPPADTDSQPVHFPPLTNEIKEPEDVNDKIINILKS